MKKKRIVRKKEVVKFKNGSKIYFNPVTTNRIKHMVKATVKVKTYRKSKDYFWVAFWYLNGLLITISIWIFLARMFTLLFPNFK